MLSHLTSEDQNVEGLEDRILASAHVLHLPSIVVQGILNRGCELRFPERFWNRKMYQKGSEYKDAEV